MIDFKEVAAAALAQADMLVSAWLPEGQREGREWSALNPRRSDSRRGSFKVNLQTGRWSDFASDGVAGGDLISLYAYLEGIEQGDACKQLAGQFGMVQRVESRTNCRPVPSAAPAPAPEPRKQSAWVPVVPVPAGIIAAPARHFHRGAPEMRWEYRSADGELLGYVCRFRTSDGGKEVLPLVFAQHSESGERKWHWMQWAEPRPLYWPQFGALTGVSPRADKVVLIVEGEKCADAAYSSIGARADVCTWSGGSKAVDKADWSPLAGRKVIIWPDCDAKREPLSREEKEQGIDPASKPYLREAKQPGMAAAERIAAILVGLGCQVKIVNIPGPGGEADGWDVADAIAEGQTPEQIWDIVRDVRDPAAPSSTPRAAGARKRQSTPLAAEWMGGMIQKPRGGFEDCYQNVYLVLKHHPDWAGIIAYDDFAGRAVKLRPTPCGTEPGEWDAYDDQRFGLWLAQQMNIVIKGDGPVAAGVAMIAREHRFHPVQDYLRSLKWDGTDRLDFWLEECLRARAAEAGVEYLRVVGRKALIGAVARVLQPGCKLDNMVILEGGQGRGKSTAISILGGDWFSDTQLDLQSKDAYMALKGVWFYEIGEMDAFNRADTTRVKGFVSSAVDRFREPYQRREIVQPRQQIFIGTTNQNEYLKDATGNRRFWPVRIDGMVDLDRLREWRDQLFAEAVHRFDAGEVWHPTRDEQERLFKPEQEFREVMDPWLPLINRFMEQPEQRMRTEFFANDILTVALSIPPDRLGPTKQESMRVASIMKRLGYEKCRQSGGYRQYFYKKLAEGTAPAQANAGYGSDESPL
ncbi:VapE domain-containing protein [Ralstonia thomasii]|jgi:putative DNA primase/helicase